MITPITNLLKKGGLGNLEQVYIKKINSCGLYYAV